MLNILKNTINRVFASGIDSDASAFITATGLSSTTQKSAITTLVKDLKASGLWSKMKAVYPMVTDNYNLLSYTEDFSNAFWTKSNANVSLNASTAPNGTNTANSIIPTTTNAFHLLTSPYSLTTTSNTVVYSGYFKPNGYNYISILVANNGGLSKYFEGIFNISTGNIESTGRASTYTGTRSIISVGNGWYRCSISITNADLNTTHGAWIVPMSTNDPSLSYSGNGTSGVYAWGTQFQMDSLSAYQPILTTPSAFMASQMKYNLKDPRDLDAAFRLTWSGGWTYSATGATPNGTNAYADTKFNLFNNVPGYNNAFGVYYRTNNYGVYKLGALGASYDQGMSAHLGWQSAGSNLYNDNLGRNTIVNSAYGTFDAFHISTVTSTASQKLYRNGVLKLSGSATAGITLPSLNFYYGAANVNGTATYFDNQQWAFGILSTGLTDQDAQLLNQIVEKYQVALSRGVQAAQSFYYNSAYSNEANTYLYSTQITGTTQVSAINTLINGLKANNLWSKMKAVYPFVTDKWNMLSYSEDFTNAAWSNDQASASANQTTAPDGTLTADKLIENTTNNHHLNYQSVAASVGQLYTFSVYLKAAERQYASVQVADSTAGAVGRYTALIDLINGVILNTRSLNSPTNTSNSITSVGNGWYRVSLTMTQGGGSSFFGHIATSNSATPSYDILDFPTYLGNGTSGIYIWGAQTQVGTLTTYQPVLGANNYSANVSAQMKFNLVNPQDSDAAFRLAFSGGWTYSTNGVLPNGTNAYADTFLIPSTNLTESSKHLSVYIRTDNTPINADPINIGALAGTPRDLLGATRTFLSGQLSSIDVRNNSITNPIGYSLITRTSTTNNLFKNNSKVGTLTGAGSSPTNKVFVGALNLNGGGYGYTNNQLALASIGDGLSDAEAALLYQLIQDYQTTLSRQV